MTPQQVFDTVVNGLRAQGGPAFELRTLHHGIGAVCKYRTSEGRKCAFGMLIPDHLYHPGMEGASYLFWAQGNIDLLPELIEHRDLVMALQDAHDNPLHLRPLPDEEWMERFETIASNVSFCHNLDYTKPPTRTTP